VVDDNLFVLESMKKAFKSDDNFLVDVASGTDVADELMENNSYNCIIIDLNMSNEFIPDPLKEKTHGGSLTGWIWLYCVVKEKYRCDDLKLVIYSDFAEELDEFIETVSSNQKSFYKNIKIYRKSNYHYCCRKLVEFVKNIIELG
jgi:DNA-binding NarL/FixJ family response regulator